MKYTMLFKAATPLYDEQGAQIAEYAAGEYVHNVIVAQQEREGSAPAFTVTFADGQTAFFATDIPLSAVIFVPYCEVGKHNPAPGAEMGICAICDRTCCAEHQDRNVLAGGPLGCSEHGNEARALSKDILVKVVQAQLGQAQTLQAIVMEYGVRNAAGDVFTEQAALDLFNTLSEMVNTQEHISTDSMYRLTDVHMEGNRTQGRVIATFTQK